MNQNKATIVALRNQGLSYRQIEKATGLARSLICYYLNAASKEKTLTRQRTKRGQFKIDLKLLHGGRCKLCGYNKCLDALDFHHRDAQTKEFGIAYSRRREPKNKIFQEALKCDLLCANCHREQHSFPYQATEPDFSI